MHAPGPRSLVIPALGFALLAACTNDDAPPANETGSTGDETETVGEDPDALVWWRDVQPIVQDKCVGCHSPGNIAPFSLETYAEFTAWSAVLGPAVESGQMPPWGADPDCNSYSNDRSLSLEQQELILEYVAGDMPEGAPADAPPEGPPDPEVVPDVVLEMAEPYTPSSSPDDYRCFLIPWPEDLTEDQFVTAIEVYPGERSIVHHVIMFIADAANAQPFVDLDAAEAGPGYSCFGGPGDVVGMPPRWLGAWVPGVQPFFAPEGAGQRVSPGSMLIMQVHYNVAPGNELADRSSIGVEIATSVERPAIVLPMTNIGWLLGDVPMTIPAGDPDVTHETTMNHSHPILANLIATGIGAAPDADLEVHDGGLHMHLFGKQGRLEVRDPGGGNETCVAEVPEWDFHWQGSYILDEPILLTPDRELHLQCWWDNSAENQPIIDGEPLEPSDRGWGDGTLDEMCLGIMYVTTR
jgi:hypothetical protein